MSILKRSKIAGAVFGFVIGDAMGATTEFMTDSQIKNKYGQVTEIIGGGWLNLKAGQVTDDTQMTLCVMDALMKYPEDIGKFKRTCARNFVDWYKAEPPDVGGQCRKGIIRLMMGQYIEPEEDAQGNGSLMRALPCALVGNIPFNVHQGMITHNNQKCHEMILEYSELIQDYLNGKYQGNTRKLILESTGFIVNTLNNAIYWAERDSFEDAIIGAVNHGGDADTIAAIAGSLAGARFGIDAIPQRWIDQLNPEIKISLNNFINFAKTYVQ